MEILLGTLVFLFFAVIVYDQIMANRFTLSLPKEKEVSREDNDVNVTVNVEKDDNENHQLKETLKDLEHEIKRLKDQQSTAPALPTVPDVPKVDNETKDDKVSPDLSLESFVDLKDETYESLCQRLIDVYFGNREPGQIDDAKIQVHNIILRIKKLLRYRAQSKIVMNEQNPKKDTPKYQGVM